jgi:glycosyltransferase involved in cell wall biosynthesis
MNSKPVVSIIMIFLNAEKFIQEAIESVFAQTYNSWELLLVDDGSTDESTDIALWHAKQNPERVRYFEHDGHQNRGMSASRNLGITRAVGEYIAFLDADDVWLPHKLEQQVAILSSQPEAAMVYGATEMWYSWTGKPEDLRRDFRRKLGVQPDTLVRPPTLLSLFLRNEAQTPGTCSVLVRSEVIEHVGGFEEAFRGMFEDQVFFAKVCLREPVFVASECWDRYRQRADSTCAVAHATAQYHSERPNPAQLTFLNWLKQYLAEQGLRETELWKAVRQAFWPYRHPILSRLLEPQYLITQVKGLVKRVARRTLPVRIRRWLWAQWRGHQYCPPVGRVRFGSLRRLTPISRAFGFDRGLPIDRYYVEGFLSRYADDIGGRVLEIGDNSYTRTFGGNRVTTSDVLHVVEGNPQATIVADLTCADHIPSDAFDCVILTQTLHLIYDVRAALKTLYRVLKPGGVVLATFPGISQISHDEWGASWCWGFTTLSARRLFEETFPPANVKVDACGNVLVAIAFLQGLATEELRRDELDHEDAGYEVVITVRAMKPEAT